MPRDDDMTLGQIIGAFAPTAAILMILVIVLT